MTEPEPKKPEKPLRLSRDSVIMLTAAIFSLRSTCNKANGAVIAKDGRILSVGYNGAPPHHLHCLDEGCLLDDQGHCKRGIHAEVNAIAWAARYGIPTEGSTLYCTTAPCPECCKAIVNSGVIKVIYSKPYSDMTGIRELEESGIKSEVLDKNWIENGIRLIGE